MADDPIPPPLLDYAPPVSRARKMRALPQPVAITLVICGTLLVGAPCIVAGTQPFMRDDQLGLLWGAGGVGLLSIVLGAFLCAPARERPSRAPGPAPMKTAWSGGLTADPSMQ